MHDPTIKSIPIGYGMAGEWLLISVQSAHKDADHVYSEKVSQGYQEPFKETLNDRSAHPDIKLEGFGIPECFIKMSNHLPDQPPVFSSQVDLMLIPKTPVVEVRRPYQKVLSISQKQFGMQVLG